MDQPSHYRQTWLTGPWFSRNRLTSQLLPAVVGVTAAVALGSAGFGLGCLYAQVVAPAPVVAIAGAVGGPEDTGNEEVATPAVAPARLAALAPGQGYAASMTLSRTISLARPVVGGWVSSHYGQRLDPFTGLPAVHRGLDFAGLNNSAIIAAAPGVVTWSGRQRGYGNLIEIDHGNGWVTRYGHNSFNLVSPGDYVKPGQTIALMGATGRATGTHLHFEVLYRGRHQNPTRFVARDA